MKSIRIGLTRPGTLFLERDAVAVVSNEPYQLTAFGQQECPPRNASTDHKAVPLSANHEIVISARDNRIRVDGLSSTTTHFDHWLVAYPSGTSQRIQLKDNKPQAQFVPYRGTLIVGAFQNKIRVILECELDDYVKGVLAGEMPAAYELEALKAQCVAARTYGLHPRVDHTKDHCNVCDSFLCCQCFNGLGSKHSEKQKEAIEATTGLTLTYNDAPILALFSACAGGHTENYEFCFSNPRTNAFPDEPLPYLKGVSEGWTIKNSDFSRDTESLLKHIWNAPDPNTYDSQSKHFRWQLNLPAQSLESHMHYVVEQMLKDPDQAPFVIPPSSSIFGHIEALEVTSRGVAGTAMILSVKTSKGNWNFEKELTIRNLFKNPELSLKRLASARVFFQHSYESNGLLADLKIFGLGSGHGVGMQQDGANGMARRNFGFRQILAHYYTGAHLEKA
jgi:stage II sporulation protein D